VFAIDFAVERYFGNNRLTAFLKSILSAREALLPSNPSVSVLRTLIWSMLLAEQKASIVVIVTRLAGLQDLLKPLSIKRVSTSALGSKTPRRFLQLRNRHFVKMQPLDV